MKKVLLAACAIVLCQVAVQAQTLKAFFGDKTQQLTYLGADFSQARYLGETALNAADFRDRTVPSFNDVVVNESKKFDIVEAFNHPVTNDLSQVTKINAGLDENKLKSDNSADFDRLKDADIQKVAGHYSGKGVGLLFVIEGLDKGQKKGSLYVVLIDLDKKKVLLSQRYVHEPQGFGVRNYWLNLIYKTLQNVKKGDYKKWAAANS